MNPRNPSSLKHKPQSIPQDFIKIVQQSFKEKYSSFFKDKNLIVEGFIYPEEILFLIGFQNSGEKLRQQNFECSIDYENDISETNPNSVINKIHTTIDALDAMIAEYIESHGDIEMPTHWIEFDFENQKVFLRASKNNTEIERQTEEFLKEFAPELRDSTKETLH